MYASMPAQFFNKVRQSGPPNYLKKERETSERPLIGVLIKANLN